MTAPNFLDFARKFRQHFKSMRVAKTGLLGLLLVAGQATVQGQYTYATNAGNANTITITGYTGPGGVVVIPQTIGALTVTGIGDYAFHDSGLTSVAVPDSVGTLGTGTFGYCSSLTNAYLGDGVTNIGDYAFEECASLSTVDIPVSVANIGDFAFYWCASLASLTIPDSVTNIGVSAFEDSGLTSISIPGSVASIGDNAFNFCGGLTNVTLANGVGGIGQSAFGSCNGLTNIAVPGSVKSIGNGAYQGCANLSMATIGEGVQCLGDYAFSDTGLTDVSIPATVTNIGTGVFNADSQLKTIVVDPQNSFYTGIYGVLFNKSETTLLEYPGGLGGNYTLPGGVTAIMDYAFYDCANLTGVTMPGSVTTIGQYAFYGCVGLGSIMIPGSVASIGDYAFGSCGGLSSVFCNGDAPAADATVFNLDEYATLYYLPCTTGWSSPFAGLPAVQSSQTEFSYITNVWSITITGYSGACGSVAIPTNINGLPVTSIGADAFYGCTTLTSLTVPGGITSIGNSAFSGCNSLTNIYFTGNAPAVGSSVFLNDPKATISCLPCTLGWGNSFAGLPVVQNWQADFSFTTNADAITITGYSGICQSVNIPSAINGFPVTSIGANAFFFCTNLTNVNIPGGITSIGNGAFQFCINLTSVTIPTGVTSIGEVAFYGCTSLTNAVIPDSVTGIGIAAFQSCFSLISVMIPASVTSLGDSAFNDCVNLSSVYFGGNAPTADSSVFLSDSKTTFYYLPGTAGWSNFSVTTGPPAVLWNPLIQTGKGNLGIVNNQFGFKITGTANIPIVVEASTNMNSAAWVLLTNVNLTNGLFNFSDSQSANYLNRYYRISSP
jgi:hypothetical protein